MKGYIIITSQFKGKVMRPNFAEYLYCFENQYIEK